MEIIEVQIKNIKPSKFQPRVVVNKAELDELTESIKEKDLIEPVILRELKKDSYELIAGYRRFKSFKRLKKQTIPAIIRKIDNDTDILELSLIENIQRTDLTSIERENAVHALWATGKYKSSVELAKKLGVVESHIRGILDAWETRKKASVSDKVTTRAISDTAGLDDSDRKKLLKKVEQGKIEASKVRDVAKAMKESTGPVKDAILNEEIDIATASKLKGLDDKKAKLALGNIKTTKKHMADIPKLVKKNKIQPKAPDAEKRMNAQEFVTKLNVEIANTANQLSVINLCFDRIEEQKVDEYLVPQMKKAIVGCLEELAENMTATQAKIKKFMEKCK